MVSLEAVPKDFHHSRFRKECIRLEFDRGRLELKRLDKKEEWQGVELVTVAALESHFVFSS